MKPTAEKCPQCGGMVVQGRGKYKKCVKCEYKSGSGEKDKEEETSEKE